jgi:hypothetical protein
MLDIAISDMSKIMDGAIGSKMAVDRPSIFRWGRAVILPRHRLRYLEAESGPQLKIAIEFYDHSGQKALLYFI